MMSMEKAIENVCDILKEVIEYSDDEENSIFHLDRQIQPSLKKFLSDMTEELDLEIAHLMSALMYLDIYGLKHKITQDNLHYLLYTACVLAQKFLDDKVMKDDDYAEIVNVDLPVLVEMQAKFLISIDYQLNMEKEIFEEYLTACCQD